MPHTDYERAIALAGLYQAIQGVIACAREGTADPELMRPCLYSLFQIEAPDVDAVFGEGGAVVPGARLLVAHLTGRFDLELARYVVQVVKLERKLDARQDLQQIIREGILAIDPQGRDLLDPELIGQLARLYTQTLSRLEPRILVHGDPQHLRDPRNQDRIRALLLAAVRAARLWRQLGGARWQFIFKGRAIHKAVLHYLDSTATSKD
ncbi:high frequency lysogenization protein HflD [Caldichromatium japonicum]|uniref:High frequency lysogenization protein HflD homolog n=1 Tax=Caldichromatium japonicum TaxID=2699430 RepID=A0A6G7VGM7_9GAMM|nr:high frequency lysogenization protein HflD [Caldichromatium japonicum]QIK38998.1 high frequency lysogenization protein HflD [Caldichromatium japonicum]